MEDMTWEHSTFVLVGVPNVEQPRISHLHARISYASNGDMMKLLRFALTYIEYLNYIGCWDILQFLVIQQRRIITLICSSSPEIRIIRKFHAICEVP